MKLSFRPRHLKRYKDILLLFHKYGRGHLGNGLPAEEFDIAPAEQDEAAAPEQLADDLEALGPTFIKLGQLLSSRLDLLPGPYLQALSRLQDKVKPFPYEEVEEIVQRELGVRISKAFESFEREPMAAASLGQVHRASLRDGRPVVVKVQRPDIRKQIAEDFEALDQLAAFLEEHSEVGRKHRFTRIIQEFKTTLANELDYQREASNLVKLAENMKQFRRLQVPLPVADYTTSNVLTMDFVRGTKITQLSPLSRMDVDGGALADELFHAYLKQVLVDGLFHADPHPGNIFVTDDGRIAMLDLGMVGHTTPDMQKELLKLLLAISEGETTSALDTILAISETTQHFEESEFRRRIGQMLQRQQDAPLNQIDVGKMLMAVSRTSADTGLLVPPELTMLGKTLLQLDQIGRTLDPDFNPHDAIRRHAGEILNQRMWQNAAPGKLFTPILEMKDFIGGLPKRVTKILDALVNSELEVKVKTPDTGELMTGFQKIANRITTGLVLAALIVGAALLMQVPTPFRIFGYPGIAMIFFLAAGAGGGWLVLSILISDYKDRKRRRS